MANEICWLCIRVTGEKTQLDVYLQDGGEGLAGMNNMQSRVDGWDKEDILHQDKFGILSLSLGNVQYCLVHFRVQKCCGKVFLKDCRRLTKMTT